MMIKQFLKLTPSFEDIADLDPADNVILAESAAEMEFIRRDVERAVENVDRLVAVDEELHNQNEMMEGVITANDGQLPTSTAAGIEAGRRVAAIALGLNPDAPESDDIINRPQLQALVEGQTDTIATESEDGKFAKLKAAVLKIWNWIKDKCKAFYKWFQKFTNIIPKKFKEVYNLATSLPEDQLKEALSKIDGNPEAVDKYRNLLEHGKLIDLQDKANEVNKWVNGYLIYGPFSSKASKAVSEFNKQVSAIKNNNADGEVVESQEVDELIKETQEKLKGKTIVLDAKQFEIEAVENGIAISRKDVNSNGNFTNITKKDIVNSVNVGLKSMSVFKTLSNLVDIENAESVKKFIKESTAYNIHPKANRAMKLISTIQMSRLILIKSLQNVYRNLADFVKFVSDTTKGENKNTGTSEMKHAETTGTGVAVV